MPSSSPGSVYVPLGLPAPRVRLPRRMLDLSIASASSFSVAFLAHELVSFFHPFPPECAHGGDGCKVRGER